MFDVPAIVRVSDVQPAVLGFDDGGVGKFSRLAFQRGDHLPRLPVIRGTGNVQGSTTPARMIVNQVEGAFAAPHAIDAAARVGQ